MNRCKDCKYWEREDALGYCNSPHIAWTNYVGQDAAMDGVEVGSHDGYDDHVRFGPDFGCIHWEEKV